MLDGTWSIDLANPTLRRVKLTRNGKPLGGGKYVISGSTDQAHAKEGRQVHDQGQVHVQADGKKLTFKPINDTCTTRRDVLTFGPWTMER